MNSESPDCVFCADTKRVCECQVVTSDSPYRDLHPPHGRPWWEWTAPCPKCRTTAEVLLRERQ